MAQAQDLRNLICGTLKLVEPTNQRDISKRTIIWRSECICGRFEHGSRVDLEKYAGHTTCPGHPFKGKEAPVAGFKLNPDIKDTLEHAEAASNWELLRHSETGAAGAEAPKPATAKPAKQLKTPKATVDSTTLPKENKVLRERLGLTGYHCETVTLTTPATILGHKAEKVIFAKSLNTDDRVLLHIQLDGADGKKTIVSSLKKVPADEWKVVADALAGLKINFRERELKRAAK